MAITPLIRGRRRRVDVLATAGIVAAAVISTGFPSGLQARVDRRGATVTSILDRVYGDRVLTARDGRALFTFGRDTRRASRCSGRCARVWAPFITRAAPVAAIGSHLRRRLLGTIRRADGRLQVTYNHKPLYHPGHNIMPCGAQTTAQFRGTFAYIDVTGQPGDVYCGPY